MERRQLFCSLATSHLFQALFVQSGEFGETGVPDDPANAPVWREIADHVDEPGYEGNRVSVADSPREGFNRYPWAMGGGGAAELKETIEDVTTLTLGQLAADIGILGMTNADEVLTADRSSFERQRIPPAFRRYLLIGESLETGVFPWAIRSCSPTTADFSHLKTRLTFYAGSGDVEHHLGIGLLSLTEPTFLKVALGGHGIKSRWTDYVLRCRY